MGILVDNENTDTAYMRWSGRFHEWACDNKHVRSDAQKFTRSVAEAYIEYLKTSGNRGRPYASSTIIQAAAAIKKVAEIKGFEELRITNLPKVTQKLPEILEKREVASLIRHTLDLRDKTMISLMYDTAVRVGELINLNKEDIDFENEWITVERRKGSGLPQNIPFTKRTAELLKQYLDTRKDHNSPLFVNKNERIIVKKVQTVIDFNSQFILGKHITPHWMRHARSAHLRECDIPIDRIRELLGHKNIMTTLRYARLRPSELKKLPDTLEDIPDTLEE